MSVQLEDGDRAPDFELAGSDDATHTLSEYRGQPVVLVFYPLAFSGVCTREHASFCESLPAFDGMAAQVLGISVDSTPTLKAFAEAGGINYPLLSDFHPRGAAGRVYGAYDPDTGTHHRWTFVVDSDGRVAHVQRNELGTLPDTVEIVRAVRDTLDI